MSSIETTQVTLRLTEAKETLKALRANKRFVTRKVDGEDVEIYITQFDSKAIEFRRGQAVTLAKTVAEALRRDNWVIVGDHLTGEIKPVFDVIRQIEVGANVQDSKPFACPICGKDMLNRTNLVRHLAGSAHADEKEGVIDVKEASKTPKIDWDKPLIQQEVDKLERAADDEDAA